ncbi:uncharacterized protein N7469_003255 [Penicillium citrinum]|uniref:Uncharacterized protein n=1 Tax=Penicillium citrinum TaxID=5077 RepID=A0A9W9PC04_PENCI|nr:uncharacterized protein N7469_003255 [Penicillium citrinum]KAJ5241664.1 hypothetical protein N7469_003255 [Penicillium citrinum]
MEFWGNVLMGPRNHWTFNICGAKIFAALTAELDDKLSRWLRQSAEIETSPPIKIEDPSEENIIVNNAMIDIAVERLRSLSPSASEIRALSREPFTSILIPLWGLICYAQEKQLEELHGKTLELLQRTSAYLVGVQPLRKLVDNLLWDGGVSWTYAMDRREEHYDQSNIIRLIDSLQSRTETFVSLPGHLIPVARNALVILFLYVSEKWLVQSTTTSGTAKSATIGESENIIQKLVSAKVAEKTAGQFQRHSVRGSLRVLELIKHLVDGELKEAWRPSISQTRRKGQGPLSLPRQHRSRRRQSSAKCI